MAAERYADEKYVNWLKVSLSLHFAKEGLETFTDDEVTHFHSNIQHRLLSCSSRPGIHICHGKRNLTKQWLKGQFTCQTDNCDKWLSEIKNSHSNPSAYVEWDNSDISQLSRHPWTCAKLYMPYGCQSHCSAKDADIAALLTLFLRCTHFYTHFSNLKDCEEIKEIRNRTMHSPSMEVETPEMQKDTAMIISFLEDPQDLLHIKGCKDAVKNIKELLSGKMELSLNKELELRVLHNKLRNVEDDVDHLNTTYSDLNANYSNLSDRVQTVESDQSLDSEQLNKIMSETQAFDIQLNSTKKQLSEVNFRMEAFDTFVKKYNISGLETDKLSDINNTILSLENKMETLQKQLIEYADILSKVEKRLKGVEDEQRSQKRKLQDLDDEQRSQKRKMEDLDEELQTHNKKIEDISHFSKLQQTSPLDKITDVKGIQDHLISLYNKHCQRVPLYPLKPEWRVHVEALYVTPNMVVTNPRGANLLHTTNPAGFFSNENREAKVDDIRSIFFSEETLCKDIYVVGKSGSGKSTLCEYLVHLWVKCHSAAGGNINEGKFMASFTFLFYIYLREARSCDIKDMISDQLDIEHELISKVLSDNTCLIILDGLDEYSQTSQSKRFGSRHIPSRRHSAKNVFLTTSRPWKIELLRELEYTMDRQISIIGLETKAQYALVKKVIELLNFEKGRDMTFDDFIEEVNKHQLSEHMETPVLLMQMIGLWFSGESFGRSQCEIYSKIVEKQLQFSEEMRGITEDLRSQYIVTQTKARGDVMTEHILDSDQNNLPRCFKNLEVCQRYKELLLKISRLASQQLFSKNRKATLVFDHDQMEISGMSDIEIKMCLQMGLLTQYKVSGEITQRLKSVSFVHKSHQEFFAAIFLSQTDQFSNLKHILAGLSDLDHTLEIEKVFTFVSGINPIVACEIAKTIMQHVDVDLRVQRYRESCSYVDAPFEMLVQRIQGVILAGIEEGKNNSQTLTALQLQDIWMMGGNKEFPPSRVFECSKVLHLYHVRSIFIHTPVGISHENIWQFVKASLPNLQKLVLYDCQLSSNMVHEVVCEKSVDLQALGLCYANVEKLEFSSLRPNDFQEIVSCPKSSIGLYGVIMTHSQLKIFYRLLSERSYSELRLGLLECTTHAYSPEECRQHLDLSLSKSISRLVLNNLTLQKIVCSLENLVWCVISNMSDNVSTCIIRCLKKADQLERLECFGLRKSAVQELESTLPCLVNLKGIFFADMDLRGHELILSLPDMTGLKGICIHKVTLATEHIRRLLSSLLSHKVRVQLGHNLWGPLTITDYDTTDDIIQQIRDNPNIDIEENDVEFKDNQCIVNRFWFVTKKC